MQTHELPEFAALLDGVCRLLSRGAYQPDATNTALWFRSLSAHPLSAVRKAFDAHVRDHQRGRFVPVPADILEKLERDDRPSADEAWATAIKASDERATVVWTKEIASAWMVARSIYEDGDRVGARMAFRDAYERLCIAARGTPVVWSPSLGHDPRQRDAVLHDAVAHGRLLPSAVAGLLGAPDVVSLPEPVRDQLARIRDQLMRHPEPEVTDELAGMAERVNAATKRNQAISKAKADGLAMAVAAQKGLH